MKEMGVKTKRFPFKTQTSSKTLVDWWVSEGVKNGKKHERRMASLYVLSEISMPEDSGKDSVSG